MPYSLLRLPFEKCLARGNVCRMSVLSRAMGMGSRHTLCHLDYCDTLQETPLSPWGMFPFALSSSVPLLMHENKRRRDEHS